MLFSLFYFSWNLSLGCDGTGTRLNVADILRTSEGPSSPRSNKNKSKKEGGKAIPPQKTNKRLTKWDLLSRRGAKKPREKVKDVVLRGHTVKTKEDTRRIACVDPMLTLDFVFNVICLLFCLHVHPRSLSLAHCAQAVLPGPRGTSGPGLFDMAASSSATIKGIGVSSFTMPGPTNRPAWNSGNGEFF